MLRSSKVVLDEAKIDGSTAGVTGIPPFSPSGIGGSGRDLDKDERGNGCLGVAPDETDDAL